MANEWSIEIAGRDDDVAFRPDVFGADVDVPLQAEVGDRVSWANLTNKTRSLVVTDGANPVPQNIPSGESSDFFDITGSFKYRCTDAAKEHEVKTP